MDYDLTHTQDIAMEIENREIRSLSLHHSLLPNKEVISLLVTKLVRECHCNVWIKDSWQLASKSTLGWSQIKWVMSLQALVLWQLNSA